MFTVSAMGLGDAEYVDGLFGTAGAPLVLPPAWQLPPPYGREVGRAQRPTRTMLQQHLLPPLFFPCWMHLPK